jgi:hypothetical protein
MQLRFLAGFLLPAALLLAQGERGTFNGTINDPTGAVIPGAIVKATNIGTNIETTAVATAAGVYRMPYLPPGTYRIQANASGFKTAVRQNVVLSVAQTLTLNAAGDGHGGNRQLRFEEGIRHLADHRRRRAEADPAVHLQRPAGNGRRNISGFHQWRAVLFSRDSH